MRELERWLTLQSTGIYHRSLHRGLGRSPQQAWNQAMKSQAQVRLPHSEQQFYLDFFPYERRAIRRDGIRMFNIFSWTDSLTTLLHDRVAASRSKAASLQVIRIRLTKGV
jgi:putative transposase